MLRDRWVWSKHRTLFPPSQEIETEVAFGRPAALLKLFIFSDYGHNNQFGHNPDSFLEVPSFDRDANLRVVNIPFGQALPFRKPLIAGPAY